MARRHYSNTVTPVGLTVAVNNSVGTFSTTSTTGFPTAPYTITIDRGTSDEEVCLVTAQTSNTFTVTRGYDGTTAHSHDVGSPIEHTSVAMDFDEANAHINDAGRDDHTQYLTAARALALDFSGVTGVAVIPVGAIMPYVGTAAPSSAWKLCDGSAISRATYSALFAIAGTTWGVGDTVSTFNIPDLRGRFPIGKSFNGRTLDVDSQTLGAVGGEEYHLLDTSEIPSHLHTVDAHTHNAPSHTHGASTDSAGSHTHTMINPTSWIMGQTSDNNDGTVDWPGAGTGIEINPNTSASGLHSHAVTVSPGGGGATSAAAPNTGQSGGNQPHRNMPPFVVLNYIIRVLP